jgi:hypothetical protein
MVRPSRSHTYDCEVQYDCRGLAALAYILGVEHVERFDYMYMCDAKERPGRTVAVVHVYHKIKRLSLTYEQAAGPR